MTTMKRSVGRPALAPEDRKTAAVYLRLQPREYDRAHTRAAREKTSVTAMIRRALSKLLDDDDAGGDEGDEA